MKMTLEFDLPEDEAEARAAVDGPAMFSAIHQFRERLRGIVKYDDPISVEAVYREYCETMEEFLE